MPLAQLTHHAEDVGQLVRLHPGKDRQATLKALNNIAQGKRT